VATLLTSIQRNYGAEDARTGIKTAGQTALNTIATNLTACKRVFQNTAGDLTFLGIVQYGTGAAAPLAGSQLPQINDGASMSVSSPAFVPSAVGNSLFLASNDKPFTDPAPILDGSGNPYTLRIDIYHFDYYYLSQGTGKGVGGKNQIMLSEWHSVDFADYSEIVTWTDPTLQANLVKDLKAAGYNYAWNTTQSSTTAAFYQLNADGSIPVLGAPTLPQSSAGSMLQIVTGALGSGYHYGVAPNTSATFKIPYPVPVFCVSSPAPPCTQTATFPSGFEIVIVGSSSARQVLMRLVVAAEGVFKGAIANQQMIVAIARDVH
jgi:hypothetical protein